MSESLPPEIIVTEEPEGVRYRLPRRQWGRFTLPGAFHLGGGLLIGLPCMSFWLWAVAYQVNWQNPQAEDGLLLIFMALGLWMALIPLRFAVRGLLMIAGHSEIKLHGGLLAGSERLGWLGWSWKRPVASLRRLEVCDAAMEQHDVRVYANAADAIKFNAIVPIWHMDAGTTAPRQQLAPGYPRAWLLPLANDLASRCRLAVEENASLSSLAAPIEVAEEPLPNHAGFVELFEKPAGSKAVVVPTDDGMSVVVPKKGLGRAMVLDVAGDRLSVVRTKLFGAERHLWSKRQLADIRVGRIVDSEGPDTPELQIQPYPGEGKRVHLPLGDEAEARWLATLLRRTLQLPENSELDTAAPFLERHEQPVGSRIVRTTASDGVTLTVPPPGFGNADVKNRLLYSAVSFLAAALLGTLIMVIFQDAATMWLFSGLGVIFGVVFLVDAINRAGRLVVLSVVGDKLIVRQSGLYGNRHQEWPRHKVVDVRVDDSLDGRAISPSIRQAIRDRSDPTYELRFHLKYGEMVRVLDGYGDAELQWLATVLRQILGVPKS